MNPSAWAEGAGAMFSGLDVLNQEIGLDAGIMCSRSEYFGNGLGAELHGTLFLLNASIEVIKWENESTPSPRIYLGIGDAPLQVQRGFGREAGSTRIRGMINIKQLVEQGFSKDIFFYSRNKYGWQPIICPFVEEYDTRFTLPGLRFGLSVDISFW